MEFEKLFHPNLALNYEAKRWLIKGMDEKIWMFDGNELIGECYGVCPQNFEENIEGLKKYADNPEVFYIYSTAIAKKFHNRGYGKLLKAYTLGFLKARNYKLVLGHTLAGPSTALTLRFGGKIVKTFDDWYKTGRIAYLCETLLA